MKTDILQFPDDLVMQWGPVLNQCSSEMTLKENLLAYKYPRGLPNLTQEQTTDWIIERDFMRMKHKRYYGETVRFQWAVPQPDGVYLFSTRFVLCADNTVLLFD